MSTATAHSASPPPADPLAKQVDAMVSDAAKHASDAGNLDASVDAAIKASSPADTRSLDEQLAQRAQAAIDDEFADPAMLDAQIAPTQTSVPPPILVAHAAPVAPTAKPAEEAKPVITVAPAPAKAEAPKAAPAPKPQAGHAAASVAAAAHEAVVPPAVPPAPSQLKVRFIAMLHKLSKPAEPIALRLGKIAPSTRQTIGWVALLTFFHAGVVWGYALLKSPTNFGRPHGHQPSLSANGTPEEPELPEPVEAPAEKEHGGSEHGAAEHGEAAPAESHGEAPPAEGHGGH